MMLQRLPRTTLCCLLAASCPWAYAATPPPDIPESISWATSVSKKPTTVLKMGQLKVALEETTLLDVLVEASGDIAQHGDAGERALWLCYTVVDARRSARLWIISDGEMGGADHYVTSFAMQVTAGGPTQDCPALREKLKPVSLSNGLWLGDAAAKPTSLFGRSTGQKGPWRGYLYRGKTAGQCAPDGFDVENWLVWTTANGVIETIVAGQVTSC
jgi:hypothetical protein